MYAQDFDDTMPRYYHTTPLNYTPQVAIQPYMKNEQIWRCPSGSSIFTYYWDLGYLGAPAAIPGSYGWNTRLNARIMADIVKPAETGVWSDAANGHLTLHENSRYRTLARHNDGGNMGYADGHAKWQNADYLMPGVVVPQLSAPWDIL